MHFYTLSLSFSAVVMISASFMAKIVGKLIIYSIPSSVGHLIALWWSKKPSHGVPQINVY
jgi:hypothetical protein